MSFRCQACNTQMPAKTSPIKTVTKVCIHDHFEEREDSHGRKRMQFTGTGTQIVQELDLCTKCADIVKENGPVVVPDQHKVS